MDLRECRLSRALTQTQLAKRAGTSQSVISYLENGQRFPSIELRKRINEALDMPVDWVATISIGLN